MGKPRVLSGREVCQILESQGFVVVRQRDSHIVVQKRLDATTVTVAGVSLPDIPYVLGCRSSKPRTSLDRADFRPAWGRYPWLCSPA